MGRLANSIGAFEQAFFRWLGEMAEEGTLQEED